MLDQTRKPIVCDLESDGLYFEVTKLHIFSAFDVEERTWTVFLSRLDRELVEAVKECTNGYPTEIHRISDLPDWFDSVKGLRLCCHNILGYDRPVLRKLGVCDLPVEACIDTLVYSNILSPVRQGGHGLGAWGEVLGIPKPVQEQWAYLDYAMVKRNIEDVKINTLLWYRLDKELREKKFSNRSLETEHWFRHILSEAHIQGMYLNMEVALKMLNEIKVLAADYEKKIRAAFPAKPKKWKIVKTWKKGKKKGDAPELSEKAKEFIALTETPVSDLGDEFTSITYEPFNITSSKQIVERLQEFGWEATEQTPTGQPRFTEDSVSTFSIPEARLIADYRMLKSRESITQSWIDATDSKSYIHPSILSLRAWTHRCSHTNPNSGNIKRLEFKKVKDESGKTQKVPKMGLEGSFGYESRQCWSIEDPKRNSLVGIDASGIQVRGLAHYMEDMDYIHEVTKEGSDIHTVNMIAAGLDDRDDAKKFFYSWIFGAGDWKIGTTVLYKREEEEYLRDILKNTVHTYKKGGSVPLWRYYQQLLPRQQRTPVKENFLFSAKGYITKKNFYENIPALGYLQEELIPRLHAEGGFHTLDGRWIDAPKEMHKLLAGLLQSFEENVIAATAVKLYKEFRKEPVRIRNIVHDEYQVECPNELVHDVGQFTVNAFKQVGEELGSLCPLDGEYKVGKNWAETH